MGPGGIWSAERCEEKDITVRFPGPFRVICLSVLSFVCMFGAFFEKDHQPIKQGGF